MRIVVLTASLPERHDKRAECIAAVAAQTLKPVTHIVAIDYERVGPAVMLNRMLPAALAAGAEWIAQVADDDLIYPRHLEAMAEVADDADIIWPWCDVEGRDWNPNQHYDAEKLRAENYIPATTMIRAELCVELGWQAEYGKRCEDWNFWKRAQSAGARFKCVEERTWLYRFHGSNQSYPGG